MSDQPQETVHVYPQNDTSEHVTDGTPCWCNPVTIKTEGGVIIQHNAADGREQQLVTMNAN